MSDVFLAIWPIVDETVSYADLCRQAERDLPDMIARARVILARPGRFSIAPSEKVPGSGRITDAVLVYEAPATRAPRRPYHHEGVA